MDKIYQIYDKGYKQMLGNEEIFKELLETFVKVDWVKNIDYDSIEKIDKSFISEEYLEKESDIIYKTKLKDNKEIYIYILLEFQSSVDKFMPIRCLNYITNLYLEMIKAKGEKIDLPAIFPIVLYNGDEKWYSSNKASDFIKNNDVLKNYGINFDVFILKENEYTISDLKKINNLISTLFLTEVHYDSELIFEQVQKILDKYGITIPVKLFLNYFQKMSIDEKVDIIDYKALEGLYRTKEEVNSMLLTAIRKEKQDLIEKGTAIGIEKGTVIGIEKGTAIGIEKGTAIGIEKGKIETSLNMIKEGFDDKIITKITGLNLEKIEELRKSLEL
ncbi:MAG: Rpn family recombination-promoting nuclease/putative transposase [Candidatus Sericytochromatia bacterium]